MFLKNLTLKGFKSFADTTTLPMEPGVTVVVGPNGSGKSNIVDAIGWVLGAQAPSTVRSAKMDDVIFAGTAKKPALGRAEVSLTIDNSSGMLPIEFTEVTITRTLFRSGDSEYALNGVPCRLLDVQELLSDTGMGRQRHIIISQGQIDAVLNARPEDRRLIIEEAAGVLKFRRRKEKAERRLTATEANLTRLEDLRREVARELRPLEKQADAARRHQGLADELRALKVHLSGRDLQRLRARLSEGAAVAAELERSERELLATLARLDTEVLAAESVLLASGGQQIADAAGHCDALREKARGQLALIGERRRRLEAERDVQMAAEVVATLESEAARVRGEIDHVDTEIATVVADRAGIDAAEADLDAARERFASEWDDAEEAVTSRAAQVRGERAALEAAVTRTNGDLERLTTRGDNARERMERLAVELERLQAEQSALDDGLPELRRKLDEAVVRLASSEARAERAAALRRDADADQVRWAARAETLESALDAARARAGVDHLAGLDGVVGTLLDVVEIDEGFQEAFEAAAGEAIAAVVLRGVPTAREALARLAEGSVPGSVLALGASPASPVVAGLVSTIPGAVRLRDHVRGIRGDVSSLLDVLVGDVIVANAWSEAVDVVSSHPGALVVTRDGGRFAPTGWRISTDGSGATGAALEQARQKVAETSQAADDARRGADEAATERDEARDAHRQAQATLERAEAALVTAKARATRVGSDHGEAVTDAESAGIDEARLRASLANDSARLAELTALLPELEDVENRHALELQRRDQARADIETQAVSVAALRSNLDTRAGHLREQRETLEQRAIDIEDRLARDTERRRDAQARRSEREVTLGVLDRIGSLVEHRLVDLDAVAARLHERRRRQSEKVHAQTQQLESLRTKRAATDAELGDCRTRKERTGLDATEARVRLEQVVESLRVDLDVDPEVALAAECPELPEGVTPIARVRELERELRTMGTINPLAVAEFEEKTERHTFLAGQLDDVRDSRRELNKVIREVDAQIGSTFAAAYADVRSNFVELFGMLFPGGTGDLTLTEPDNPLETGIEITAKPSGKNVRTLSLLSGGERSLVALAFLFAVFRSRSSPFYVMDEVEAALDDVNLHRFLDLVAEFRSTAQLIIVSHQKRTMEAADALFGVTMQPGGGSKVVSERAGGRGLS